MQGAVDRSDQNPGASVLDGEEDVAERSGASGGGAGGLHLGLEGAVHALA